VKFKKSLEAPANFIWGKEANVEVVHLRTVRPPQQTALLGRLPLLMHNLGAADAGNRALLLGSLSPQLPKSECLSAMPWYAHQNGVWI